MFSPRPSAWSDEYLRAGRPVGDEGLDQGVKRSAKILTASVELTAIVAALFLGPELDSWQCTRGRRLATIMG